MDDREWLARRFEEHRAHLRTVAYRMLGSLAEADEAVQDAWLRASGAGADGVENLRAWLTTIVARVCLNTLQARRSAREEASGVRLPDPVITLQTEPSSEQELLLADSVGLALQVVLDTLSPAERLAFVLHDLFGMPFDELAKLTGRTPAAARQLASRARRRVQGASPDGDADVPRQRRIVDAFFAAARKGDFEALVEVLDPEVVLRCDGESPAFSFVRRGAAEVAKGAIAGGALPNADLQPALVNGAAGAVVRVRGEPFAVMGFTVAKGRIVELDIVMGAARLARLGLQAVVQA